jgi:hypothetical protein
MKSNSLGDVGRMSDPFGFGEGRALAAPMTQTDGFATVRATVAFE